MKTIKFLLLTTVLTLLWGCSSGDDETSSNGSTFVGSGKPAWSVDLTGNEEAPSWLAPDPTKFESSMFIMVKLQEELVPYSTNEDRLTVFIGDECRAVPAEPNKDDEGNVFFVLKIRGNSSDRAVSFTLCYYCALLHQIFDLEGQETFVSELTYGVDEDFVPPLLEGCKKYPANQLVKVNRPANLPFAQAEGDMIGAFVGNECRGVGRADQPFTVFCTSHEESFQLRYYSETRAGVYSFHQNFKVSDDEAQILTLEF